MTNMALALGLSSLLALDASGGALAATATPDSIAMALKSARPGAVLRLAPGRYDNLIIYGRRFAPSIAIVPLDPRRPPVITTMKVGQSSGITFRDVEFAGDPVDATLTNTFNYFQVAASSGIRFEHDNFHGPLNGVLENEASGLLIRDSQDVTVANSEFRHLHNGIGHLQDEHLTISGNSFHDLRDDGIRGGGSSWVTITHNHFQDMHPDANDADHPDCIQFWTSNTKVSAHDILIEGNFYRRGAGRPVQGVFLGNELKIPYERVTILDNVFVGAGYNGIVVGLGKGVTIRGNVVAGYPDFVSRLRVLDSEDVEVSDNKATEFGWSNNSHVVESNARIAKARNTVMDRAKDGGDRLESSWKVRRGADNGPKGSDADDHRR